MFVNFEMVNSFLLNIVVIVLKQNNFMIPYCTSNTNDYGQCLKGVEHMFAAGQARAHITMQVSVSRTRGKTGHANCHEGRINNRGRNTRTCKATGRYVRMKLTGGTWRLCEVIIFGRSLIRMSCTVVFD